MHRHLLLLLIGLFLLCTGIVQAQGEDELIGTMIRAPFDAMTAMSWAMYSASYLIGYGAVLCIGLSCFSLFPGFDISTYFWIFLLWLGGMVIATLSHVYLHNTLLAVLISLPALFLFSTVLARFHDLLWQDGAKFSLVVALLLGAYFTPPWTFHVKELLQKTPARTTSMAQQVVAHQAASLAPCSASRVAVERSPETSPATDWPG